ncbi:trypsin-like peptidase domain-containing protein [Octadecabacter sp. 1_MG-2023]|uniref:trypsin-like serine peptidase n=1 Tax=unclassified Octadecabacter TaxID=196158 RepID=UPI001C07F5FA|nr:MULTISPECIES: trypsin-like peptidase domain-containing protein [unclassified Octadecabacter]MBU2994313.1 trypsin-like peptidase domain-containing protein [Octadecabacter sp. B2R22]MDO6734398.1 trypsin-like peptidase domain-containing protein [Octadecabacter sp. 1_MG-2023]
MRKTLLSLAMLAFSSVTAMAQTTALQELSSGVDARGWEAVGRLDIDGKGFCTGALIAPDLVLTAAHCMFDKGTGSPVDPSRVEFLAGLRGGRPEATRQVRSAVVHPSYEHTGDARPEHVRYDVALLQLSQPIRTSRVEPFEISSSLRRGTEVGVVSYAQDRSDAPSLQEVCNVLGQQDGVLIMDCDVDFGSSGAPIFRSEDGVPRLVSVVSAMAEMDGDKVALGMDLAEPIAVLRLALEEGRGLFSTPPASARVIRPGERANTGALFVRP